MTQQSPPSQSGDTQPLVAIIGGGPAGLIAAETLANAGIQVELFDSMPSLGRKFLMAGRGGLNITHTEPFGDFISRYGERAEQIQPMLQNFDANQLRQWASELGVETFVGSSGRVFPREMKAAPLLRAWLHRLRAQGVRFHVRHRWTGWNQQQLTFDTPEGVRSVQADATLLALGGGSWAKLGSDGTWYPLLEAEGVKLQPIRPANCGFICHWSDLMQSRHAGEPLKGVVLSCTDLKGNRRQQKGELMLTRYGLEGGLIYALSAPIRDTIEAQGSAKVRIDLVPDRSEQQLSKALSKPRGSRSLSNHLRRQGVKSIQADLLREVLSAVQMQDMAQVSSTLKSLPLTLTATRPVDEAISTAGGVSFEAMTPDLMLQSLPGTFCAGEMLDWEAPTGGYLLTACFASGVHAAKGVMKWLDI
ncbi:TIGR03862 family flavoprotein [Nitrincola sp. MINF-07-Sa-05]|uniref:TIGR03862 family flavoprotein n=1 Tax=Nitrincola salilacus TaxID=3400273 RepID=UPI00391863B5